MTKWVRSLKWLQQELKDIKLYIFFLTPFVAFYSIMQYRLRTNSNLPCIIAATLVFVMVLLYGIFKYLEVEYLQQHIQESLKKKKKSKKIKRE